jgi:hypothetical protein
MIRVDEHRNKFNAERKEAYLERLREGMRRGKAAQAVGVDRSTVWRAVQEDPEFAAAVDQAELDACEIIEDALFESAKKGNVTAQQVWLYNRHPDRWKDRRNLGQQDPLEAFLAALPDHIRPHALALLGRTLPAAAPPPGAPATPDGPGEVPP